MGKPRLICFDAPVSRGEECRLACDCSKVEITEDEQGEPLDVGRKTRSISPAFRRALAARDKGAWRFFNARGESLHGCAPGHTQPLADWRQLPAEHAERGIHTSVAFILVRTRPPPAGAANAWITALPSTRCGSGQRRINRWSGSVQPRWFRWDVPGLNSADRFDDQEFADRRHRSAQVSLRPSAGAHAPCRVQCPVDGSGSRCCAGPHRLLIEARRRRAPRRPTGRSGVRSARITAARRETSAAGASSPAAGPRGWSRWRGLGDLQRLQSPLPTSTISIGRSGVQADLTIRPESTGSVCAPLGPDRSKEGSSCGCISFA